MEPQKTPSTLPNDEDKSNSNPDSMAVDASPTSEVPAETSFAGSVLPVETGDDNTAASDEKLTTVDVDTGTSENAPADMAFKPETPMPSDDNNVLPQADKTDTLPLTVPPNDDTDSQADDPSMSVTSSPLPISTDSVPSPLPVSARHHSKKSIIIGLIIAAVVLLLSGGAAAAYYYVVNTPENVLKRALANTLDSGKTKTVNYNGVVSMNDDESDLTLEGTFEGGLSSETGAFNLSGKMDVLVTNIEFESRSVDGKTFYLKVGGLDGLPALLSAGGDATDSAEGASIISFYAPLIELLNDQWLEINPSLVGQVTGNAVKGNKLSDADRAKIVDAYKQNSFLVVKEEMPDEDIKGVKSHHYRIAVDKASLKAFFSNLKSANTESIKITQDDLDEINKSIDSAKFENYPLEIWIAKSTKMINQLALKNTDDGATMSLRLTMDGYNQPVKVEKPADAKPILDILGNYFGGGGAGAQLLPTSSSQSGTSL